MHRQCRRDGDRQICKHGRIEGGEEFRVRYNTRNTVKLQFGVEEYVNGVVLLMKYESVPCTVQYEPFPGMILFE